MKLILEDAPENLIEYVRANLPESLESTTITGVDFQYDQTPESRWQQLVLAGQGSRLWTNKANPLHSNSPLYAGKLPSNAREADLVIADLKYTKLQFDFYNQFGVTYIGRIQLDPRNLLILDHKKPAERHDKVLSEALYGFLRDVPHDWWGTLGVVSAGNVEKLEAFLIELQDSIPLVFTTGAAAKLRYAGRDYVHLLEPKPGKKPNIQYGLDVRGQANDLSKKLATLETETGEPQGGDPGWSGKTENLASVEVTQ